MNMKHIAIVGGGPAGLMAAEHLSKLGHAVTVYEQMPTVGRKLLMAGKSGLNITHSEDFRRFLGRFDKKQAELLPALEAFKPDDIQAWAEALGSKTYIGSSGRVFPVAMKASPLLRAWLKRLDEQGVTIFTRHRWTGFQDGNLLFETPEGHKSVAYDALLLALGGASWPKLGSNGAWTAPLEEKHIRISPMQPANCGFDVAWSDHFAERFAGEAVKSVTVTSAAGTIPGEFVVTRHGIEGGLIYSHAAALRDQLDADGKAEIVLDLAPGRDVEKLAEQLAKQGNKQSFSTILRKAAGLTGVKAALLRELSDVREPQALAHSIKALHVPVLRTRPIAEAISTAGGVDWNEIDAHYMLKTLPGVFVAGEMIDWEAPTGGYLLSACFATGKAAASGIDHWLLG